MNDHSISEDQARYSTSIVAKYLDTDTVKASTKFYRTNFPSGMVFTKADAYISDEQVQNLTSEFNIHYRACIVSLIYLLSKRVCLSFAVHKLEKFSSNPGKVTFERLMNLLRYISYNEALLLKYSAGMNDAPVSYLLVQASIKTENQLIAFSDSSCRYFPDTVGSIGA